MSMLKPDDFEGVRMKPIFFDFLSSLAAKQEHWQESEQVMRAKYLLRNFGRKFTNGFHFFHI